MMLGIHQIICLEFLHVLSSGERMRELFEKFLRAEGVCLDAVVSVEGEDDVQRVKEDEDYHLPDPERAKHDDEAQQDGAEQRAEDVPREGEGLDLADGGEGDGPHDDVDDEQRAAHDAAHGDLRLPVAQRSEAAEDVGGAVAKGEQGDASEVGREAHAEGDVLEGGAEEVVGDGAEQVEEQEEEEYEEQQLQPADAGVSAVVPLQVVEHATGLAFAGAAALVVVVLVDGWSAYVVVRGNGFVTQGNGSSSWRK